MERMGLWGDGAPFKSFVEFLETVQRKGLGQSLLQASFIFMLNKKKEPVHCFGGRGGGTGIGDYVDRVDLLPALCPSLQVLCRGVGG